jgi:hypothetical protein
MSDLDPLFSKSCYENRDAPTPATVMAGRVPAIRSESLPRICDGELDARAQHAKHVRLNVSYGLRR